MSEPASLSLDRRTGAKTAVGFAAAATLLYLFGRVVGWGEIAAAYANADGRWLALAFLSTLCCLVVWAKAWDVILAVVDVDIPFGEIVLTYFAATFADYVTPFGKAGGGPLVAYVLSTDERASYQDSLAGVVTADALNLVPFFVFSLVGVAALSLQGRVPPGARTLVVGLVGLAVLIPVAGAAAWVKRGSVESLVARLLDPVARRTERLDAGRVRHRVREFYAVVERIVDHPREVGPTLAYSFGGWAFFALPLYLSGRALGVPLDPLIVLFVVPASSLASVLPTPGGTGAVEAAVAGLLVVLTPVAAGTAAAVAVLYRIASYWFGLAVGGLSTLYVIYRT